MPTIYDIQPELDYISGITAPTIFEIGQSEYDTDVLQASLSHVDNYTARNPERKAQVRLALIHSYLLCMQAHSKQAQIPFELFRRLIVDCPHIVNQYFTYDQFALIVVNEGVSSFTAITSSLKAQTIYMATDSILVIDFFRFMGSDLTLKPLIRPDAASHFYEQDVTLLSLNLSPYICEYVSRILTSVSDDVYADWLGLAESLPAFSTEARNAFDAARANALVIKERDAQRLATLEPIQKLLAFSVAYSNCRKSKDHNIPSIYSLADSDGDHNIARRVASWLDPSRPFAFDEHQDTNTVYYTSELNAYREFVAAGRARLEAQNNPDVAQDFARLRM